MLMCEVCVCVVCVFLSAYLNSAVLIPKRRKMAMGQVGEEKKKGRIREAEKWSD